MNEFKIVGLMSGTSLDGLDMAYCHFIKTGKKWAFKLIAKKSVPYSEEQVEKLKHSVAIPADDLLHLDILYGQWLGEQVDTFVQEENLQPAYIASHGHTVFHQPERRLTYQIGDGQELANVSGFPVVCDFRRADVLLGGQGAPLVPIGDQALFGEYDFCLNLGGISNVSVEIHGKRIAYDISPVNMLLNRLAGKLNLPFDRGGRLAAGGHLDVSLLQKLNDLAYYKLDFPKSLGFEWFTAQVLPIIEQNKSSIQDQLHTATVHIAQVIAQEVLRFNPTNASILMTGGGVYNDFLIQHLRALLHPFVEVVVPHESLIEYKEAIVFGFMGALRLAEEVNCLSTVTGATKDSSAGKVFYPA